MSRNLVLTAYLKTAWKSRVRTVSFLLDSFSRALLVLAPYPAIFLLAGCWCEPRHQVGQGVG